MIHTRTLAITIAVLVATAAVAPMAVTAQSSSEVMAIETQAATDVTDSSANLHGNLTYFNDSIESADVYFKYWEQGNQSSNTSIEAGELDTEGVFQAEISGLTNNTTYTYQAFAEANDTVVNGSVATFTTAAEEIKLEIETEPATNVTESSATLNGNLTALDVNATDTTVWFQYWEAGDPSTKTTTTILNVSSTGSFSSDVANLSAGDAYVFRAHAKTNATGVNYTVEDRGNELRFSTHIGEFSVRTLEASDITNNSATLNGEVTGLNNVSSANVSFTYWIQGDPANQTVVQAGSLSEPGEFSKSIAGLQNDTTYVYFAKANTTNRSVIGENVTFTPRASEDGPTYNGEGPFGLWLSNTIHEFFSSDDVDRPFGQWVSSLIHANNPTESDDDNNGPPTTEEASSEEEEESEDEKQANQTNNADTDGDEVSTDETDGADDVEDETDNGPPSHANDHASPNETNDEGAENETESQDTEDDDERIKEVGDPQDGKENSSVGENGDDKPGKAPDHAGPGEESEDDEEVSSSRGVGSDANDDDESEEENDEEHKEDSSKKSNGNTNDDKEKEPHPGKENSHGNGHGKGSP